MYTQCSDAICKKIFLNWARLSSIVLTNFYA